MQLDLETPVFLKAPPAPAPSWPTPITLDQFRALESAARQLRVIAVISETATPLAELNADLLEKLYQRARRAYGETG